MTSDFSDSLADLCHGMIREHYICRLCSEDAVLPLILINVNNVSHTRDRGFTVEYYVFVLVFLNI